MVRLHSIMLAAALCAVASLAAGVAAQPSTPGLAATAVMTSFSCTQLQSWSLAPNGVLWVVCQSNSLGGLEIFQQQWNVTTGVLRPPQCTFPERVLVNNNGTVFLACGNSAQRSTVYSFDAHLNPTPLPTDSQCGFPQGIAVTTANEAFVSCQSTGVGTAPPTIFGPINSTTAVALATSATCTGPQGMAASPLPLPGSKSSLVYATCTSQNNGLAIINNGNFSTLPASTCSRPGGVAVASNGIVLASCSAGIVALSPMGDMLASISSTACTHMWPTVTSSSSSGFTMTIVCGDVLAVYTLTNSGSTYTVTTTTAPTWTLPSACAAVTQYISAGPAMGGFYGFCSNGGMVYLPCSAGSFCASTGPSAPSGAFSATRAGGALQMAAVLTVAALVALLFQRA
jgi:hypothetical protein